MQEPMRMVRFTNPFTWDIVKYVINNDAVEQPENYEEYWYTFDGWYSWDIKVDFPLHVNSDLTLTAKYDKKSYIINFYNDKTKTDLIMNWTYEYQTKIEKPEDPEKHNYDFLWWKAIIWDADITFPLVVTWDIEVYAVYESPLYENLTWWDGCYRYKTYTWWVIENPEYYAEIISYSWSCNKENLEITGSVTRNGRNYEVQSIWTGAFKNIGLTWLVIPDTVKEIYTQAFMDNTKLRTVKIWLWLKNLYDGVFVGCTWIENLDLWEIETIWHGNFIWTQLTWLIIPNTVTTVATGTFANNTKLKTLTLWNNVTTIWSWAFINSALTWVTLPTSLTTLWNQTFCSDETSDPNSVIWVLAENNAEKANTLETSDGTSCFTIKWSNYTITYDKWTNKWEAEVTTWTVSYNTILSLTWESSEKATAKEWFQFIWWSTWANDTNVMESIKVDNDITLYAVYRRPAIQKTITFHLNGSTWFTYNSENYTEDQTFNLCEIPAKYNNEGIGSCSVSISFPTIKASTNTPVVVWWTTGLDLRTNVYTWWLSHTIIVYENNENVELYAQTKSSAKTYTVSYQTDLRVNSIAKEPDTCTIVETYNWEVQPISCPEGITLPTLTAKTGYNTPKWNAWVAEYMPNQSIYLSWDLILTGTATPNTDTAYVVKHYYQMLENNEITNKYKLEQTDAWLSWTTEEILTLANLKSEVSWFTYSKAKVNWIEESTIDLTNIKDYEDTAAIDWNGNLVIQLFYTRNQYNYVETQVANAHLTRSPENNSYYYGQEITLTWESDQWYTLEKITTTVNGVSTDHEWTTLVYTMPAANVTFTPVLREHIYTIHFNGNWATSWTVADVITSYSENKELPTNVEEWNRYERKWYHFIWWSRNQEVENQSDIITALEKWTADDNGNVTLYAQWEVNIYEIKFVNENWEELQVSNVAYGRNPIYNWETPVKTWDEQYSYVFEKWQPLVQAVTWDITYTATFKQLLNKYTVTFKDSDGSIIQEKEVAYGTTSWEYKIADPKKTWYTFKWWTPELQTVDSDIIYKATYTVNQYKISVEAWEWVEEIQWAWEYDYWTEITLTWKAMTWYHFEWWVTEKAFIITVWAADQTVKIRAIPNTYRVVFKANGWEGIMRDQVFTYNQTWVLNANSFTKPRHLFAWWTGEDGKYYADKNNIYNLVTTWSVELTAIWIEWWVWPTPTPTPTSSGWSSWWGWWGWWGKWITPTHEQEHSSAEDDTWIENKIDNSEEEKTNNKTQSSTENSTKTRTQSWTKANENTQEWTIKRTQEELDAYKYAYKYWITTLAPKEEATPDGYVKRWHLAKMLVNYSVNVLWKEIPTVPKECKNWSDDKDFESDEIREYAEKACALWLMWIETEKHRFNPNQEVTRAQFGTTISRILYGDKYQWGFPYYEKHLKALNENNIMKNIVNPQDRIELRKWVWVMLQRIQEKKK